MRLQHVALGLLLLLCSSCGDDDDENPFHPPAPSSQLTGPFVGANDGGLMTVAISLAVADLAPARLSSATPAHEVEALGTLALDSGANTVNLTGTYSEETDSLSLTGQGYVVKGRYDSSDPVPGITGEFSGPLGPGLFDCALGGTSSLPVYCGENTRDRVVYERMHLGVASLGPVFGFIVIDGETIHFEGTATGPIGGVRSINATQDLGNSSELLVAGTLNTVNESVFGQWSIEVNGLTQDSGEWNLAPCLAGTTGPN